MLRLEKQPASIRRRYGDERDVVYDGPAERAAVVGLGVVAQADEHHPGGARGGPELDLPSVGTASAAEIDVHGGFTRPGVRLELHPGRRGTIRRRGAAVGGVPGRELEPVPAPFHGGVHLLQERGFDAGHELHGARAARHREVRRVYVPDGLLVRHDLPPGQRGDGVLVHRRHQHPPRRARRDVRALLEAPVPQHVVVRRRLVRRLVVERLDGEGVDDGAARGVFLLPAVVGDYDGHEAGALRPEGPGVGVPADAGVHRLHGEFAGLGRRRGAGAGRRGGGRHAERLVLGAGARRGEREGVVRALREAADLLLDGGAGSQPQGLRAVRHRQDHVPLLLARAYELDVAGRLPAGDRVLPGHHRAAHLGLVWRVLEVAVLQRTCARGARWHGMRSQSPRGSRRTWTSL
uniref:Uncharacterized protein n=1 Tax=Zea mays TaxID=4577 RepID=A0A804RG43_MAIZE